MHPPKPPFAARRALAHGLALALAGLAVTDVAVADVATRAVAMPHARVRLHALQRAHAGPAPAGANLPVTSCADSGPGTLRQAMLDAHNNTTVDFSQLTCSTITLTTGALTDPNTDSLKLIATPAVVGGKPKPVITIDGGGASRIIEHRSGGELELQGLALRNGRSAEGKGGCVYAMGRVFANAVSVSGCSAIATGTDAALGGGIWSDDDVVLVYSTISGNSAVAASGGLSYGGGVFTSYGFYSVFSTIENNQATGIGYGGGVSALGYTAVKSSLVDGNAAAYGAGLDLFGGDVGPGDLLILDSTIALNHATGFAAGIEANGALSVYNSTIAGNVGELATNAAGIVVENAYPLDLVSSIVAGNTQAGVARDIGGAGTISGSTDLVGSSSMTLPPGTISADPLLGALADNGGQSRTMRLQAGSLAIDAGSNPLATLCDQRGGIYVPPYGMSGPYERQAGSTVDIGAFESGAGDKMFGDGFELIEPFSCYPS